MKIIGVIPARFGSQRFPGKPLVPIAGKPLLQWVIEGAKTAEKVMEIWVATDNREIYQLAESCDVRAVMTDPHLPSGSDRVWAAVQDQDCDLVINIQGDEPLVKGEWLDQLVEPFFEETDLEMSTLGRELQKGDLESLSTAKIVLNQREEALYFSRLPIPYSRIDGESLPQVCCKHVGLYAYRKEFLGRFCAQKPVPMELAESLEQLRALYLGARIRVVKVDADSWGVDTPEDVAKIERMIQKGN